MMDRHGELLLCKPCRHQAEVDAARPAPPSGIRKWGVPIVVILVLVFAGICIVPLIRSKPPVVKIEGPRDWTKDPASQWPPLALQIAPSEGSAIPAGWQLGPNACVVERNDGTILCVTAVTDPSALEDALNARNMAKPKAAPLSTTPLFEEFTRALSASHLTANNGRATFTRLLPESRPAFEQRILVFAQPSGTLPKDWIVFRTHGTESSPGMKVTVTARDPKTGAQVPLEAAVASNKPKDTSETLITLIKPYFAAALTGAPVVDARGNLVAVITRRSATTDPNGRATEFYAYGMHALQSLADKAPPKK
jgi:hypothetical protein